MTEETENVRLTGVLRALEIATSSWYRKPIPENERRRPGPQPKPIPQEVIDAVVKMATDNPWYGYKRIARAPTRSVGRCRREVDPVTDRQAYRVMKLHDLLQKRRPYKAELHQSSKLYELLPQGPNELWQMDEFRRRYNGRRPHWALIPEEGGDPLVPEEVYREARSITIPRWQGWAKGAKEKLEMMMAEAA